MWTSKNRGGYDRIRLRYPSDVTDQEWALVEPLIPPAKRGGNRRHVVVREVINGLIVYSEHRLSVAGGPPRPAAPPRPLRLFCSVACGRPPPSHPRCPLFAGAPGPPPPGKPHRPPPTA